MIERIWDIARKGDSVLNWDENDNQFLMIADNEGFDWARDHLLTDWDDMFMLYAPNPNRPPNQAIKFQTNP